MFKSLCEGLGLFADCVVLSVLGGLAWNVYSTPPNEVPPSIQEQIEDLSIPEVDWSNAFEVWSSNTGEPCFNEVPKQSAWPRIQRLPPVEKEVPLPAPVKKRRQREWWEKMFDPPAIMA